MEWSSRLPPKGPYCKRCRRTLFEAAPQAFIIQALPKHAMSTSIVLVNAIPFDKKAKTRNKLVLYFSHLRVVIDVA